MSESVESGSELHEIDRTDCPRCGGDGQVVDEAAGRTSYVECPACDNVPKAALPDDPPADPRARLNEIEDELQAIEQKRDELDELEGQINDAQQIIKEVAWSDHVNDDTEAVLCHIARQVGEATRHTFDERHIPAEKRTLKNEKRKLERYLDALRTAGKGEKADR